VSSDRNFRSRVEVWLYRRLRPLVIERQERRSLKIESLALRPRPLPGAGLARVPQEDQQNHHDRANHPTGLHRPAVGGNHRS
jgi:hypothetical protein